MSSGFQLRKEEFDSLQKRQMANRSFTLEDLDNGVVNAPGCLKKKNPFAAIAFPVIRKVFPGSIVQELMSVQPMRIPSKKQFFVHETLHAKRPR